MRLPNVQIEDCVVVTEAQGTVGHRSHGYLVERTRARGQKREKDDTRFSIFEVVQYKKRGTLAYLLSSR